MTEQFIKWFDEVFSEALFNGEEREYLKTYTCLRGVIPVVKSENRAPISPMEHITALSKLR